MSDTTIPQSDPPPAWCGEAYGAVPHSWLDAGVLQQLSREELLALLVLLRYANYGTGTAYPSAQTVGDTISTAEAAKDRKRIGTRALAALVRRGMVAALAPGGRGRTTRYRLVPPAKSYCLLAAGNGDKPVTLSSGKRCQAKRETVTSQALNGDSPVTRTKTNNANEPPESGQPAAKPRVTSRPGKYEYQRTPLRRL